MLFDTRNWNFVTIVRNFLFRFPDHVFFFRRSGASILEKKNIENEDRENYVQAVAKVLTILVITANISLSKASRSNEGIFEARYTYTI